MAYLCLFFISFVTSRVGLQEKPQLPYKQSHSVPPPTAYSSWPPLAARWACSGPLSGPGLHQPTQWAQNPRGRIGKCVISQWPGVFAFIPWWYFKASDSKSDLPMGKSDISSYPHFHINTHSSWDNDIHSPIKIVVGEVVQSVVEKTRRTARSDVADVSNTSVKVFSCSS